MENVKNKNLQYFLDMDLADLSEDTPLSEGDPLELFEWESTYVAAALNKAGVPAGRVPAGRARALFLMRAFYFLGVFRGGEAVRAMLLGQYEVEGGELKLSDSCTETFAEDLRLLNRAELDRICKVLSP